MISEGIHAHIVNSGFIPAAAERATYELVALHFGDSAKVEAILLAADVFVDDLDSWHIYSGPILEEVVADGHVVVADIAKINRKISFLPEHDSHTTKIIAADVVTNQIVTAALRTHATRRFAELPPFDLWQSFRDAENKQWGGQIHYRVAQALRKLVSYKLPVIVTEDELDIFRRDNTGLIHDLARSLQPVYKQGSIE